LTRSRLLQFALAATALALTGCALNPVPDQPQIQSQALPNLKTPGSWKLPPGVATPETPKSRVTPAASGTDWLDQFADARLRSLVREALLYNTDLQTAAARVELAAGRARLAGSTIYPAVNFLAHGGGKSGGDGSGLNAIGFFANWELDLWGRVRYQSAAGQQQYDAAVLDEEYARQSIAALVVKSWLLAIEARLQRGIAEDIVTSSDQATGLARDRLRIGRSDEYDLSLAEANLESARDAARQLALAQDQALRAIEILIGRYPSAAVDIPTELPPMPGPVPVGLPSDLLERRPDVLAAERRVAAAFNAVGEAKAARLPKIALTASISAVSSDLVILKDHANPVWGLGTNILAPLFNGYALQAQVDIRTAEQSLAIADYGRIGARAFNEVETALSSSFAADEREAILMRAVERNARTLELAQVRYRVGSGDLRAVLQQSVALFGARTNLLQVQSERRIQRVNLYLAVGGAFDPTTIGSIERGDAHARAEGVQVE
jgi:NodT family efflux transporter outer membrane factor (OMF) lipoprotein